MDLYIGTDERTIEKPAGDRERREAPAVRAALGEHRPRARALAGARDVVAHVTWHGWNAVVRFHADLDEATLDELLDRFNQPRRIAGSPWHMAVYVVA